MVVLVHQIFPGHQLKQNSHYSQEEEEEEANLEEENSSADCRSDDSPAANKEVAGIVSNHVVQSQAEPPGPESPGDSDALEEHQK